MDENEIMLLFGLRDLRWKFVKICVQCDEYDKLKKVFY